MAISLSITAPTTLASIDTTDASISLSGIAKSDAGISRVSWSNDRGGQGIAGGTEQWHIENIPLEFGVNLVTVIAEDYNSATTSQRVSIFRESGEPGTATIFWQSPVMRTDGSPLTNLRGFRIHYGRMTGIYDFQLTIDNPGVVAHVVDNLVPGEWFFVMTAYDSQGVESVRSNEVTRMVQ